MPKRKENAETMLTENTAVESVASFETTEAVAVAEPSYGDTTTAALADIKKDQKIWRALVFEVVDGASEPPEFLLKKLAAAVGLSDLMAQTKFKEDVPAIRKLRQAEATKESYESKRAAFVKEYADEKELQQQLRDMIQQTKDLRSLINKLQNIERVIGQTTASSRRIGAAFSRLF